MAAALPATPRELLTPTFIASAALRAENVEAPLTDFGDVPHGASKRAALPEVLTWFDGLRP